MTTDELLLLEALLIVQEQRRRAEYQAREIARLRAENALLCVFAAYGLGQL